MDDGGTWTQFKDGLPPAPVSWITVEPRFHDVVISTYGRGLFILPNITMLEQTGQTAPPAPGTTKLYEPAPIFRLARSVYHAGQPSALPARARDRAGRSGEDGDPRRGRQGRARRRWSSLHAGLNGDQLGPHARRAEAGRADDHAARQSAHLGRGAVQGRPGPPDHALGHHAADRHPDGGARQVPGPLHRRRHRADARRSR